MAETLFGENISLDKYDRNKSKDFVMKGVADWYKPQMQKARGSLTQRGFGRYHAPTIEGQVYNPIMGKAGESVRRGLTDLYYKDENLALEKRKQGFREDQFGDIMHEKKQKRSQGKVLCTELYRQGLLPFSHIKADLKFLKRHVSRETHENYLRWATPLVEVMKRNKLVTLLILPFVRLWSGYMKATVENRRPPISGKVIHNLGIKWGQLYKVIHREEVCNGV